MNNENPRPPRLNLARLPRNLWAVSLTSMFTDVSSEMIFHLLPLYLSNVLGARTSVIGLIEGVSETTSSLTRILSGWLSDRMRKRKPLTVLGYSFSAIAKPLFLFAASWPIVMVLRFADRLGKGVRTAPRDALVADSIAPEQRGMAFGLHRAADTFGALLGLLLAAFVVYRTGPAATQLAAGTFRWVVALSIIPAMLGVATLILIARDPVIAAPASDPTAPAKLSPRLRFSPRFWGFIATVALFTLGNSSDAFLVLRAQERGLTVFHVMMMLVTFNLVYTLASVPAGMRSDKIGRSRVILGGWIIYALVYAGFGFARAGWQVWLLMSAYGLYYAMFEGTSKALVADLVPVEARGTAYGVYNAAIGVMALPASLVAGLLWQGLGSWQGFGAAAPFWFGAALALCAVLLMALVVPRLRSTT
jgi:MFS family permease